MATLWNHITAHFKLLSVMKTATRTFLRKFSGTLSASPMKMTRSLLQSTAVHREAGFPTIDRSQTLPSLSMIWMMTMMGLSQVAPRDPNLNCCSVSPTPLPAHLEQHIRRLRRRGLLKKSSRRTSPCSESSTS